MGMEQAITFAVGGPPPWLAVRQLLVSGGFPVQVRMIDGELAFPDEEPPENWRELRLGTAEGKMVTVRREKDRLLLVIWGNADRGLIRAWNVLTWAFAEAGQGSIQTPEGPQTAAEYGRRNGIPGAADKDSESGG
jgi:hypothetical protein